MTVQTLEDRLQPGDVQGVMACIREDFDQRAYFITGAHSVSHPVFASQFHLCFIDRD